jgi:hypothetical protein
MHAKVTSVARFQQGFQRNTPMLVPDKLRQNAIISILHGVEDFERSQKSPSDGGDPFRAISAARNLFAGVLLLFKYRLVKAVSDQEKMSDLIYKPPRDIVPHPDGEGGVEWRPVGKFSTATIDVGDIEKRFNAFDIKVDWGVMRRVQEERNHLEHMHPTKSVGAIGGIVAELFPVLGKFIVEELEEVPATLLDGAWTIMLKHHDFFLRNQQQRTEQWNAAPISEKARPFVQDFVCDECGSPLTLPVSNSHEAYTCIACGHCGELFPQLETLLEGAFGGYDPRDGDEPPAVECPECERGMFSVGEGMCYWCDYRQKYLECGVCSDGLGLDEQHMKGLCSRHYCQLHKDD